MVTDCAGTFSTLWFKEAGPLLYFQITSTIISHY